MIFFKKTLGKCLLTVLLLQQFSLLATVQEPLPPVQVQPGPSILLASPANHDLAAVYQCSTTPIIPTKAQQQQNANLMRAMLGNFVLYNEHLAQLYPENSWEKLIYRIKLLKELQFINKAEKRSILTQTIKPLTNAGHAAFCSLIAQGNTDWAITKNRQDFIKELTENPELLKKIRQNLNIIKKHEEFATTTIHGTRTLLQEMTSTPFLKAFWLCYLEFFALMFASIFTTQAPLHKPLKFDYFDFRDSQLKQGEFQPFLSEGQKRDFMIYWALCHIPVGAYFLQKDLEQTEALGSLPHLGKVCGEAFVGFRAARSLVKTFNSIRTRIQNQTTVSPNQLFDECTTLLLNAGTVPAMGKVIFDNLKEYAEKFETSKKTTASVRAIADLQEKLEGHPSPVLSQAFGQNLRGNLSKNWAKLVAKANKNTFAPDLAYGYTGLFRINLARVYNFNDLFVKTAPDYGKMMQFYGEIDVYATLAQLYLDSKNQKNDAEEPVSLCFAQLLLNSEESTLKAENVWHPIIPSNRVRTNTITLGGDAQHPRHAIITGPNAAGKSISMKSLLVNILLGQTFGVACAQSFAFTPYAKIIARFTSADDASNDQSKFMLEATDVVALLKELEDLKPGEKAFVVTDELFSGTEVKPAILLSAELCSTIAPMKNVNYLLATHYKDLTKLKQLTGNLIENYKVTATVDDDSNVSYPFKLMYGVGDVNVAFDIFLDQMRKQGVCNEKLETIIKNARGRTTLTHD